MRGRGSSRARSEGAGTCSVRSRSPGVPSRCQPRYPTLDLPTSFSRWPSPPIEPNPKEIKHTPKKTKLATCSQPNGPSALALGQGTSLLWMGSHPSPIMNSYSRKVRTVMVSPNTIGPITPASANRINVRPDITALLLSRVFMQYITQYPPQPVSYLSYYRVGEMAERYHIGFACPVGHRGSSIIEEGHAYEFQR